jgi:hypothetical protein
MRAINFIQESAAKELADRLPTLKRTDYNAIDELMTHISVKHNISGHKLHQLFVSKYGHTPDTWVKKIKQRNEANENDRSIPWVDRNSQLDDMLEALAAEFEELYSPSDEQVNEGVETPEDEQKIRDFVEWSINTLYIQKPYPKFTFSRDTEAAQRDHRTGLHTSDGSITIYIENRNLVDILRTIFHELVHHRQDQLGMIKDGDSYPGSPVEAMADMMAGKYIKIYGKQHPEIFQ